jgi:NAD(P)H-dependent flavin oxidoreductase YrpB (nitropropane dioxygenase family)
MKLPKLKIGKIVADIPIIQGGMAVRISTGRLAGAVAAAGGIGIIGASGMEVDELKEEIRIARSMAQGGIIGINIMFAAKEFLAIVLAAVKEKVDLIIAGAGFSRDLFKIGKETGTVVVPIVSSARLAKTSRACGADAIIVEGKEAGGHLGTDRSVFDLLPEVLAEAGDTPVIAAGGLTTGEDICKALKMGASGVQIATRFVLSEECNASKQFKEIYQRAKKEDVTLITSPVGLPGRAIKTPFVKKITDKEAPKPVGCDYCLKNCNLEYCIIQALINSQGGDVEHGIVFSGENVWKIKNRTIRPAKEILEELVKEAEECYKP